MTLLYHDVQREPFAEASHFREAFFACLSARRDELFELADALLCADGPVTSPMDLTLLAEHRRGHGALYDALNRGRIDAVRLRRALAALPQPRAADDRLVLAVDVSNWLRPDAECSAGRLFCHTFGRGRDQHLMIPGWPYSFVAALEAGRTSWCQLLDAVRLGPEDDVAAPRCGARRRVPPHPRSLQPIVRRPPAPAKVRVVTAPVRHPGRPDGATPACAEGPTGSPCW